ncbi:ABC transporter family protein, partial [Kribbella orskensis]
GLRAPRTTAEYVRSLDGSASDPQSRSVFMPSSRGAPHDRLPPSAPGHRGPGSARSERPRPLLRLPDALDPRKHRTEITSLVGVQLQASELPDRIKAREALELYASFYPSPADPADLLERLGLTKVRNTAFARLSGGQKQRLSIALALIGNPKIAIPGRAHHRARPAWTARS